jgi:4-hydroxybenzoyl-CoA thioesterase
MLTNRETIRIEWGDCDPAGIVYFPRYVEYFDRCTRALFERAGVFKRDMLKTYGIAGIPVVDMKAQFVIPSRYGEDVIVESCVCKWGNSSFVVRHRLMKGEAMAVECFETRVWVVQVSEDPVKYEGRSIPREVKEQFGVVAETESRK